MNARRCCEGAPAPSGGARRLRDVVGCVVPAAGLVLLPKCPICLAAYLTVGTGIGVGISTAAHLRTLLLISCLACLGYFVARFFLCRRRGALR